MDSLRGLSPTGNQQPVTRKDDKELELLEKKSKKQKETVSTAKEGTWPRGLVEESKATYPPTGKVAKNSERADQVTTPPRNDLNKLPLENKTPLNKKEVTNSPANSAQLTKESKAATKNTATRTSPFNQKNEGTPPSPRASRQALATSGDLKLAPAPGKTQPPQDQVQSPQAAIQPQQPQKKGYKGYIEELQEGLEKMGDLFPDPAQNKAKPDADNTQIQLEKVEGEDEAQLLVTETKPKPLTPAEELKAIEDLMMGADKSKSSAQEILGDALKRLQELAASGEKAELKANLATDPNSTPKGQFKVKPFTIPGDPKVYYSIDAEYVVKAKVMVNGKVEEKEFKFTRTIFTGAKTPEQAVVIASQFKQTVTELAKNAAEMESHLDDMSDSFKTQAMTKHSFFFSFEKSGKSTRLASIHIDGVDDNKKPASLKHDVKGSPIKYLYNFKDRSYREINTERTPVQLSAGQILLETKEELRLKLKGCSISTQDENQFYKDLEADRAIAHAGALATAIEKQEKKFEEVKNTFAKDAFFQKMKLKVGKKLSDEDLAGIKQEIVAKGQENRELARNLRADGSKLNALKTALGESDNGLSHENSSLLLEVLSNHPEVKTEGKTEKEQIETLLALVEKKYRAAIKEVQKEDADYRSFNKRFGQLKRINEELEVLHGQYNQLKKKSTDLQANATTKQEGDALLTALPEQTKMDEIKNKIAENKTTIQAILDLVEGLPELEAEDIAEAEAGAGVPVYVGDQPSPGPQIEA